MRERRASREKNEVEGKGSRFGRVCAVRVTEPLRATTAAGTGTHGRATKGWVDCDYRVEALSFCSTNYIHRQ